MEGQVDPICRGFVPVKVPMGSQLLPGNLENVIEQAENDPAAIPAKTERDLLSDPLEAALRSITRESFPGAKEWAAWWRKNKRTFQVVPEVREPSGGR